MLANWPVPTPNCQKGGGGEKRLGRLLLAGFGLPAAAKKWERRR
jgi:hypothetical protein